jgi:hypothetical protein
LQAQINQGNNSRPALLKSFCGFGNRKLVVACIQNREKSITLKGSKGIDGHARFAELVEQEARKRFGAWLMY